MKLATPDTFNLTTHGGIVPALALGVRLMQRQILSREFWNPQPSCHCFPRIQPLDAPF